VDAVQLKRIPLFSDASDEELKQVAAFAQSKEVPDGEVVVEEGGFSRELLAIEDGTAEVTREGEHLADLGPGDVFGEAGMLDDSMRAATDRHRDLEDEADQPRALRGAAAEEERAGRLQQHRAARGGALRVAIDRS
jgi:cAMP-binding proteins - catabolite gene activator and regulatory subunit of cAMP-dependent protein kinases